MKSARKWPLTITAWASFLALGVIMAWLAIMASQERAEFEELQNHPPTYVNLGGALYKLPNPDRVSQKVFE